MSRQRTALLLLQAADPSDRSAILLWLMLLLGRRVSHRHQELAKVLPGLSAVHRSRVTWGCESMRVAMLGGVVLLVLLVRGSIVSGVTARCTCHEPAKAGGPTKR